MRIKNLLYILMFLLVLNIISSLNLVEFDHNKEQDKTHYTKYEHARIVGARALQISQGAPFMLKLSEEDLEKIGYNPLEIAKMEYKEGVIPITVKKPSFDKKIAK